MWEINGLNERAVRAGTLRVTFVEILSLVTLSVSYYILSSCVSSDNRQIGIKTDTVTFAPRISTLCTLTGTCFHGYRIKHNLTVPAAYVSNATTTITYNPILI
jgi:hypothetical protein